MQYQGAVTNVGKYITGNNTRGPWSLQHVTLKNGNVNSDITVWGKPDLSRTKGKLATIEGVEWGTDKKDNRVLELRDGTIVVKDQPAAAPQASSPPSFLSAADVQARSASSSFDGIPTQAQYEVVLGHAIEFVGREFKQLSTAETDFRAVAEVVKGYMVAFAKGDFRVAKTAAPAPAAPAHPVSHRQEFDDDIPF